MSHPTDDELILKCRDGDKYAWQSLYDRHAGCMWKIAIKTARRKGCEPEECLSHVHEAFLRCVRKFDVGGKWKFVTLLWTAAERDAAKADPGGAVYVPWHAFARPGTNRAAARAAIQFSFDAPREDKRSVKGRARLMGYNPNLSEHLDYEDDHREALRRLSHLTIREVDILTSRAAGEKLQAIGDRLGVSKERVRQLETKAKAILASA